MSFEEWLAEERARLEQFQHYWHLLNESNPGRFPLEMEGSDWDEAYQTFVPIVP